MLELLVALALAGLLCALIFSAYSLVTAVRRGQLERQAPEAVARDALRRLADDLERTFCLADDAKTGFRLQTGAAASNALWELSFCRCAAGPAEAQDVWADLDRVTYRLEEQGDAAAALVCIAQPLAGPGAFQPPVTNAIIRHLEQAELRLFDGTNWHARWPTTEAAPDARVPRAARLEITARVAGVRAVAATEVLIPVGIRIESRSKHAGAEAARSAPPR